MFELLKDDREFIIKYEVSCNKCGGRFSNDDKIKSDGLGRFYHDDCFNERNKLINRLCELELRINRMTDDIKKLESRMF